MYINDNLKKGFLAFAAALFTAVAAAAQGIGTWKNYLAYSEITDVQQAGGTLFVLASGGLYSYNTADQSITTFDKTNVMSDCGIQAIAWCQAAGRLVAVYSNGNIDLVSRDGSTINMPDYYNYSTTADKTVYGLDIVGRNAYLSTGFGVVCLNVADAEVAETYNLGFRVDYVYSEGGRLYAASSTDGIYSAQLGANLIDPASWTYAKPYVERQKTIDPELLATAQTLAPGGPKYNHFAFMTFEHGRLYTTGGYYRSGGADANRPGTVQILQSDGQWTICQDDLRPITGYFYVDINCVAPDPSDPDHLFAAGRAGMYEFRNGRLERYYNSTNSPLQTAVDRGTQLDDNYAIVNSIAYGTDGSLWLFNCQTTDNSLMELTADGTFTKHDDPAFMYDGLSLQAVTSMMFDSRGLLWFTNNNYTTSSFYCYQPSTGAVAAFTPRTNQNGTTLNLADGIRCIAEDADGNMWVGTMSGPLMLDAHYISGDDPVFTQVIVPRNDGTNYGDYLLDGIDITAMAVDGAGRKWFGTSSNGVYLVSRDNMTQIEHFTSANSPLLSDNIESIAVNGATGEVFFGTDMGLCSYMGDATTPSAEMTKDNVYAYPNPVRPDYTGPITVTGLSYNADVKITTVNGTLVAEGRSNGGTFTWDGCDLEGRRVASGVYMVLTATENGDSGTVCKIAVIK